jgi:hypothetical protein
MRLLLLILTSLSLLLVLPAARAQWLTADDFFNDGAHLYLSNNIPSALLSVSNGMQLYPDDEKLKKLYQLLKQQQQQQQQQQKNQQQQQNQQKQKQDQQQQQQQNAAKENQNGQKAGETNGQPQTAGVAQMTPEEAKRLLDQQKNDEQVLVMKPQGKPQDTSHSIKDW